MHFYVHVNIIHLSVKALVLTGVTEGRGSFSISFESRRRHHHITIFGGGGFEKRGIWML